jgi:hypothetical protein
MFDTSQVTHPVDALLRSHGVCSDRHAERIRLCSARTLRRLKRGQHVKRDSLQRIAQRLGAPLALVRLAAGLEEP